MYRRLALLVCAVAFIYLPAEARPDASPLSPPPPALVTSLKLKPFYRKWADANGFPVVSSERVSDYALREAAYLIDKMLEGRDDVRQAMIKSGVRFVVIAPTEMTTVIPEYSGLTPPKYWDKRARGLGAVPGHLAVSCGEENLLCYPGDPYTGENILIHEFSHTIHEMGLKAVDPTFEPRLKVVYRHAMDKGLWKGAYAATNFSEYWAEGVQSWFDCNPAPNHSHNDIRTRAQLKAYDPELAELISSVFKNGEWRYERPDQRKERGHLAGYDPAKAPHFAWDPALVEWYREYEAKQKKP
jgi:hypothetical protein